MYCCFRQVNRNSTLQKRLCITSLPCWQFKPFSIATGTHQMLEHQVSDQQPVILFTDHLWITDGVLIFYVNCYVSLWETNLTLKKRMETIKTREDVCVVCLPWLYVWVCLQHPAPTLCVWLTWGLGGSWGLEGAGAWAWAGGGMWKKAGSPVSIHTCLPGMECIARPLGSDTRA